MALKWDGDIAEMNLTDFEKNGLQVHRSYEKAFRDEAIRRFVESEDRRLSDFDLAFMDDILELIRTEDERYLLVVTCSFVDDQLKGMFEREIPSSVPGGRASMLNGFGALSRLSQRIQSAYAFGMLSLDLLEQVDKLRKLRNDISHKWDQKELRRRIHVLIADHMHPIEEYIADGSIFDREQAVGLGEIEKFRIRLTWLVGRVIYETQVFPATIRERISSEEALYGKRRPKLLEGIADRCTKSTRELVGQSNGDQQKATS